LRWCAELPKLRDRKENKEHEQQSAVLAPVAVFVQQLDRLRVALTTPTSSFAQSVQHSVVASSQIVLRCVKVRFAEHISLFLCVMCMCMLMLCFD
jgi:hypothetical protein